MVSPPIDNGASTVTAHPTEQPQATVVLRPSLAGQSRILQSPRARSLAIRHCRASGSACAATSKFYRGEALQAAGPEGRDVESIAAGSTLEIEQAVSRVLHRLVRDESVAPADIVVLVSSSRTGPLKEDSVVGAFELTGDQNAEPGKVLLESIRRFKGLERQVVIVTGIDDLAPEDEHGMLYVALSRARAHLVVIAAASTIARCQGPACP